MQQPLSRDIPLFATSSTKALDRIMRNVRTIDVPRRDVIFAAGDAPAGIYIVMSGCVKLALPSSGRGDKVVALLGPGESFGISALLVNKPHVVTAAAARDCTLAHLPRTSALRMMREPKFAQQIAVELSRRFHELLVDIQGTARHSALQRTAIFLLRHMPKARGRRPPTIRLLAGKADIASKLDLTGAHFSRILRELASAGAIDLDSSVVTIKDVSRLRGIAARPRALARRRRR